MKTAWTLSAGLALVLLTGGHSASAQDRPPSDFPWLTNGQEASRPAPYEYAYNPGTYSPYATDYQPSPIERLNTGTKKFFTDVGDGTKQFLAETDAGTKRFFSDVGTGTKKFFGDVDTGTKRVFAGARDAIGFDRPEPKTDPTDTYVPWSRDPHSARYRQFQPQAEEQKPSWPDLGSWFRPAEPKPAKTFDDWWALKRLDP
ncbi:MAG TPA: hypothetical protein VMY42_10730 [Thermoguttaceae bacterium]|nr:hypothetical protein [Thermoguttaceae bacterium]